MGLSASQARLLSVTQRINNNELKSEILANNKIRLAEDGTRASEKYMNALNSKKLDYKVYKQSGDMETVALTFNALTNYSDLKTQYALMSANGQVYVNSEDAKNYENANNLYDFLNSYKLIEENDDGGYTLLDDKKAQCTLTSGIKWMAKMGLISALITLVMTMREPTRISKLLKKWRGQGTIYYLMMFLSEVQHGFNLRLKTGLLF